MKPATLLCTSTPLLGLLALGACGADLDGQGGTEPVPVIKRSDAGGRVRKVIVDAGGRAAALRAALSGAVRQEVDYGSFHLLLADAGKPLPTGAAFRDDLDQVAIGGYVLDTTDPAATYRRMPAALRRPEVARALSRDEAPPAGLYLVQFIGPLQDRWLGALAEISADIVAYLPESAYVVRVGEAGARGLALLLRERRFVQFVGAYEPGFRLSADLLQRREAQASGAVDLTVQIVDGPAAAATLVALRGLGLQVGVPERVLRFLNVPVTIPAGRESLLDRIAHLSDVFGIEERTARRRLDEAQGQIVAGNLSGNTPTGPGYLAWLQGKGFGAAQFGSFAVNVVDDAYSLTGHPDLPAGRIAFQKNPTGQSGVQGGHGFLNAHIVGGYNDQSGAPYTDAGGYRYGLGVAPFARVGLTAIFGGTGSSPAQWERAAWADGSRISTNSWGYTGASARRYDTNAQQFDVLVRDADSMAPGNQQLSILFAAGNSGSGSNTVSSPGTAKNILSVAAGENVRPTGDDGCGVPRSGADSANDIIGFSSRGPVNPGGGDGRIKPDITAPGTHIQAGIPQANYDGSSVCNRYFPAGQTLYGWSSGTSHSTPGVAGGAALAYQYFLNQGYGTPSPAMMKAFLMNSATHMTGVGANDTLPSPSQGMGRMDLGRAFDGAPRLRVDQTEVLGDTGQVYTTSGTVARPGQPFRVTLAFTDAPGATTGAPWVNNLDLEVTVAGQVYKGNVFGGASSVTGGSADIKNNVESVFVATAPAGPFTVRVRAANIAGDGVPGTADATDQDFALVIYNGQAGPPPTEPTIGAAPGRLDFSAVLGGAAPPSQALRISNVGGGTLSFGATDDALWLSLAPASGTAPADLQATVSPAGLAAGVYNATVTITGMGATNSPFAVPVSLTLTSAGGSLLRNGSLEPTPAPWVLLGNSYHTNTGAYGHSGTGYAILGFYDNASGTLHQDVAIPAGIASAQLRFWLNVTTAETDPVLYDRMVVEARRPDGSLIRALATYSNLDAGPLGTYQQRGPFDLRDLAGQTVRIQFRATNDPGLASAFRIDDVTLD